MSFFAQRKFALGMAITALIRVALWMAMIIAYLFRVEFVVDWFDSVAFVSVLSALALLLTDWAQFAASTAQLSATSVGEDVEEVAEDVDDLGEEAALSEEEWL